MFDFIVFNLNITFLIQRVITSNLFLKMKLIIIILIMIASTGLLKASDNNPFLKSGNYDFLTTFNEKNYNTSLKIKTGNKTIYERIFEGRIDTLIAMDIDNNGQTEFLINNYSGGAHCCNILYAGKINKDNFTLLDSIRWGNSFYEIRDMYQNGKYEFKGVNDMFAYAFTNYAQSQFSLLIYRFDRNKFIDVTKEFPALLYKDIEEHEATLKPYSTDSGFACPKNTGDDTFNTDAGAVKAALAPIVADYYNLGEVNKGYEFVDKYYKCIDKEAFIDTLKNVYNLK